jgi:replication-associated recombination protein RarA
MTNLSNLDNEIIDRIEQRDACPDVVERMRSNMPFQHDLYEWYGAPGIGKTTLVQLLRSECEYRNVGFV